MMMTMTIQLAHSPISASLTEKDKGCKLWSHGVGLMRRTIRAYRKIAESHLDEAKASLANERPFEYYAASLAIYEAAISIQDADIVTRSMNTLFEAYVTNILASKSCILSEWIKRRCPVILERISHKQVDIWECCRLLSRILRPLSQPYQCRMIIQQAEELLVPNIGRCIKRAKSVGDALNAIAFTLQNLQIDLSRHLDKIWTEALLSTIKGSDAEVAMSPTVYSLSPVDQFLNN